ncbi:MAG TPA: hypothetical protein VIG64_13640, partial [Actinomycetota bacterium]|jgi:hypothetical protein
MQPRLRHVLSVLVALVFAACGPEGDRPTEAAGGAEAAAEISVEDVSFGEALAQIRGHHLVALELYEAGDEEGAAIHAGHPVAEILDSVASELAEHEPSLATDLEAALSEGVDAVAEGAGAPKLAAAFDKASATTIEALNAVVGESAGESSYQGSVVAALLGTAAHEYEEAVDPKGNDIRLLEEYQDGYAFVIEAERMYDAFEDEVASASAEEAEEIDEAFEVLSRAFPSPTPPNELVDVLEVESAAELIGHELEETVGAAPVEESDPAEVVAEIEELLTEIEKAYAAGDPDAAAELSAEAYLENYEVIEAGVIELAPEVNEELEPLLGADLRRQIQASAPQEEIESMIARARELLAEALHALETEH